MDWRPIADLPSGDLRHVVFWNPCQGPMYEDFVFEDLAADYRDAVTFSHFLILPEGTEQMREEHDRWMRERHG